MENHKIWSTDNGMVLGGPNILAEMLQESPPVSFSNGNLFRSGRAVPRGWSFRENFPADSV